MLAAGGEETASDVHRMYTSGPVSTRWRRLGKRDEPPVPGGPFRQTAGNSAPLAAFVRLVCEHRTFNPMVVGSNPTRLIRTKPPSVRGFLLF